MKIIYFSIVLSIASLVCQGQINFYYTGSVQTYVVPAGVTAISVDMQGAKGGGCGTIAGGAGGRTQAILLATTGQVFYIYVGGAGGFVSLNAFESDTTIVMCAFGGGGGTFPGEVVGGGGGGGGASDIRLGDSSLSSRVVVAAGGGGAIPILSGGYGGGTIGGNGNGSSSIYGGFGATLTTGAALGTGGIGVGGGGGGGGYYGGEGGNTIHGKVSDAAGGGGSSYVSPTAVFSNLTSDYNFGGNGIVIITPLFECSATVTAGNAVASPVYGSDTTTFTISLAGTSRDSGLTYQWQESASGTSPWTNITGATNANYTFSGLDTNTFFRCAVTCLLGTSTDSSSSVQVQIYPEGIATTGLSHLKVYPNPATNIVIIDGAINCELEIIDIVGREVIPAHLVASSNEKVDVSQLGSGMYFFEMRNTATGVKEIRKIVKD